MTTFTNSFRFAINGIVHFFRTQLNAKIHLAALALVIASGFIFNVSGPEWILLLMASGFVIAAEAFNTAIEMLVDIVSPQWNEKAGKIKDVAAGAVLIAAVTAIVIAGIVFIPRITS